MSNLSNEKEYDNFKDLLEFIFEQSMKTIFTCLPGIINSFNPSTKRAMIQIAINQLLTNGNASAYPLLVDVPVIFPSGGGFNINFPLSSGDAILVVFSQRALDNFKQTFSQENGNPIGFFSLKDAVAIPGFGALQNTPATSNALNLQNNSATNYISVTNSGIIITAPTVTVNGDMLINGSVTWTGTAQGLGGGAAQFGAGGISSDGDIVSGSISTQTHVHGGVTTGGGSTGGPQ